MILRTVVLASGLCGALAAAQFPAYSQQYTQRLGGAVDALQQVVFDFDASARTLGLTRVQALEQMQGSAFIEARRADMTRTFERHAQLSTDLATLNDLGPFSRAYHITRLTDPEIARNALTAFQPALPMTFASAVFAGLGFLLTVSLIRAVGAVLRLKRALPA